MEQKSSVKSDPQQLKTDFNCIGFLAQHTCTFKATISSRASQLNPCQIPTIRRQFQNTNFNLGIAIKMYNG